MIRSAGISHAVYWSATLAGWQGAISARQGRRFAADLAGDRA
jgi:hypothetical protein